jgi:hypothetical protein
MKRNPMNRTPMSAALLLACFSLFQGCDKLHLKKNPPLKGSRDFWLDRCEIKYKGKDFPLTGTVEDMAKVMGPFDRHEKHGDLYFWDDLGLQVNTPQNSTRITSIDIYFAREESDSEMAKRLADRPQDRIDLAEIKASYPQRFFKGEMVLEGALIGPVIDFEQVDDTRHLYLKNQTGPDAHVQSIRQSWSATRYAYERTCADGQHRRFIFTLISGRPPHMLESLSIASDNVLDSATAP